MSIPNLFNKIKSSIGIDNIQIMYCLVIIGVAICSFLLGRVSCNFIKEDNFNINKEKGVISDISNADNVMSNSTTSDISTDKREEKRYVASKNGKMYYSIGCGGAKRIKPENEIWFSSKTEAESSGYKESTSCK